MNDKNLYKAVLNQIEDDKEEMVSYLLKVLNFKSVNYQQDGDEEDAQNWINGKLQELNFTTEMFDVDPDLLSEYDYFVEPRDRNYKNRPNVAGILKGSGGGRSIVLNGHMDVVPIGDEDSWKYSPWGKKEGDRIYGRGSSDMKGGLIAMLMAVKAIKNQGIELKGDIIFHSVVDEESSGNGTLMCVAKGYTGDAGIVGECTDLEIQRAHRGVQFLRVKTTGISGHAANRQKLVNANDKMIIIYNKLLECEENERLTESHPLLSSPTISVGMLHGGDAPHIVPDKCEINCDVKYLPQEDSKEVREIVENYIMEKAQEDEWLKDNPPVIDWMLDADPSEIDENSEVVAFLKEAYANAVGEDPKISGMQGCADMRHLIKRGDTPSVLFGPGIMQTAHQADEYVEVDYLLKAAKTYAVMILNWCQIS
jgi:acetylornithine deacetylase